MITEISTREIGLQMIEELRARKEVLKKQVFDINNQITDIDIQIRDIRQHMPLEKPITKVITQEERLQRKLDRLTKQADKLREMLNAKK